MEPEYSGRTATAYKAVGRAINRHDGPAETAAQAVQRIRNTIDHDEVRKIKVLYIRLHDKLSQCEGKAPRKFKDSDEYVGVIGSSKLLVWEKLILKTRERNFDLPGYIFFALKKLVPGCREVYPNMLLSDKLLTEYDEVRKAHDAAEQVAWTSQDKLFRVCIAQYGHIKEFALNMTEQQQKQFVLLQNDGQFSPLFLFVHAEANDLYEICHRTQSDALLQYSGHPAVFDEIFREYGFSPEAIHQSLTSRSFLAEKGGPRW